MKTQTKIKLIGAAVGALGLTIIVLQNRTEVETKILFISMTMPLAVLLFLVAVGGAAVGVLGTLVVRSKHKPGRAEPGTVPGSEQGPIA